MALNYVNTELRRRTSLTEHNDVILVRSDVSLVRNLLDPNGKILTSLLPDHILGGMQFCGTYDDGGTNLLSDILTATGYTGGMAEGKYVIAATNMAITGNATGGKNYHWQFGDDNNSTPGPTGTVNVEKGDWIIMLRYSEPGNVPTYQFGVVNNAYGNATATDRGVVRMFTTGDNWTLGAGDGIAVSPTDIASKISSDLGAFKTGTLDPLYATQTALSSGLGTKENTITTLPTSKGGTGVSLATVTQHGLLIGDSGNKFKQLATGSVGQILRTIEGGVPAWGTEYSYTHPLDGGAGTTITTSNGKVLANITVNAQGHVTAISEKTLAAADIPSLGADKIGSGTLGTARGGTGISAYTKGDMIFSDANNSLTKLPIGLVNQVLKVKSNGEGPEWAYGSDIRVYANQASIPAGEVGHQLAFIVV